MLGITTADAIGLGTLIIAVLAAWKGATAGDHAKAATPPPPTPLSMGMATFADTAVMMQLVGAITRLAEAVELRNEREAAEERARKQADEDELRRIARDLREKRVPPP